MKIMMRDERLFQGTPVQIVQAMKFIAFGVDHLSLIEYTDWVAANARKFEDVELKITGATDEERCASLVGEMIRTGLTRRV
jgi:hypothetical protein